jgi:hypothetical protein
VGLACCAYAVAHYRTITSLKLSIQASVLFEVAAFVASHPPEVGDGLGQLDICEAYMKLAEATATELEEELAKQVALGVHGQAEVEQRELKAKITMRHYLVIVAHGCCAEPGTVKLQNLSKYAELLCKHMLLVCPMLLLS